MTKLMTSLTVVKTLRIVSICHLLFGENFSAVDRIPLEQSDLKTEGHLTTWIDDVIDDVISDVPAEEAKKFSHCTTNIIGIDQSET